MGHTHMTIMGQRLYWKKKIYGFNYVTTTIYLMKSHKCVTKKVECMCQNRSGAIIFTKGVQNIKI